MSFVTINTELPSELNHVLSKNKKLITDVIFGNSVSIYFDPNDWHLIL
ncbi:Uncharacterised protein [Escherichia coli]|nr:Uncharacterised protein [Escherichia coli]